MKKLIIAFFILIAGFVLAAQTGNTIITITDIENRDKFIKKISFKNINKTHKVTIENKTSYSIELTMTEGYSYGEMFNGENNLIIKEASKKDINITYVGNKTEDEISVFYDILLKLPSTTKNLGTLQFRLIPPITTSSVPLKKEEPDNKHLTISNGDRDFPEDEFEFSLINNEKSYIIKNIGNKLLKKSEIIVDNNLDCIQVKYSRKDLGPDKTQKIKFSYDPSTPCKTDNKEYYILSDGIHKITFSFTIKKFQGEFSYLDTIKDFVYFLVVIALIFTGMFLIFIIIYSLFKAWQEKRLNNTSIRTTETTAPKTVSKPSANDSANIQEGTNSKELEGVYSLLKKKESQIKTIQSADREKAKKIKELEKDIKELEKDISNYKQKINEKDKVLANYRKSLYQTTQETLRMNDHFSDVTIPDNSNEWDKEALKIVLSQMIRKYSSIDNNYNRLTSYKTTILHSITPIYEYFDIPINEIKDNENNIPKPDFFSTHFNYFKNQDIDTPEYIKHFGFYIEASIYEVENIKHSMPEKTKLFERINTIHENLSTLKKELGHELDRSILFKKYLNLTDKFELRNVSPDEFYNLFLSKKYGVFSKIILLNIYKKTVFQGISIEKEFDNAAVDKERLVSLISLTKLYFQKLFGITFIETYLFQEKYKSGLHENSKTNRPNYKTLFPDFQKNISTLNIPKDIVNDVDVVGFKSDNKNIQNKKPIVVINV